MDLALYQVDAFTSQLFGGNPAAVCPLDQWQPDATLQAIAAENNLSETAFFVERGDHYGLRWFTPTTEVELCGHATLAAAFVILECLGRKLEAVRFSTRSGPLSVTREGELLVLDLPSQPPQPCEPPADLIAGLGRRPAETLLAKNYLAVYETEEEVRGLAPDFAALAALHPYGIIVSAPANDFDFVSRFFAPSYGIDEDPATGSAHCTLTPYWARRLDKPKGLRAFQASERGAELVCEDRGERVAVAGHAVLYLEGRIRLA